MRNENVHVSLQLHCWMDRHKGLRGIWSWTITFVCFAEPPIRLPSDSTRQSASVQSLSAGQPCSCFNFYHVSQHCMCILRVIGRNTIQLLFMNCPCLSLSALPSQVTTCIHFISQAKLTTFLNTHYDSIYVCIHPQTNI